MGRERLIVDVEVASRGKIFINLFTFSVANTLIEMRLSLCWKKINSMMIFELKSSGNKAGSNYDCGY